MTASQLRFGHRVNLAGMSTNSDACPQLADIPTRPPQVELLSSVPVRWNWVAAAEAGGYKEAVSRDTRLSPGSEQTRHHVLELETKAMQRFANISQSPLKYLSWLKVPTMSFTFKTLLRHYAKWP